MFYKFLISVLDYLKEIKSVSNLILNLTNPQLLERTAVKEFFLGVLCWCFIQWKIRYAPTLWHPACGRGIGWRRAELTWRAGSPIYAPSYGRQHVEEGADGGGQSWHGEQGHPSMHLPMAGSKWKRERMEEGRADMASRVTNLLYAPTYGTQHVEEGSDGGGQSWHGEQGHPSIHLLCLWYPACGRRIGWRRAELT